MSRVIIVVALLCLATFVLASDKELLGAQRCSNTTVCQDGFHCCSITTCCPNSHYCCHSGRYCCSTSNASRFGLKVPAVESLIHA